MKSQRINRWVVVGSLLAVIGITGVQSSLARGSQPGRTSFYLPTRRPSSRVLGGKTESAFFCSDGQGSPADIRKAAEAVRDAEGDEAKDKAEENLRELLSKRFEADMEQRQAALEEMVKHLEN